MAQATRKRPHRGTRTLVRAPDGKLYMLTKTDPPVQLTDVEARKVEKILDRAEEKLGKIINEAIPRCEFACTRSVHVTLPEVFMR
jgi:hypothetical protein